jgi:CBS domain containing-hemolysin-like protein
MALGFAAVLVLVAAILIVASALISATETALFSFQETDIRKLREADPAFGGALEKALENPRRLLSTLLLADALANLPLVLLCLFAMRGTAHAVLPLWLKGLLILVLLAGVCDLWPKLVAMRQPQRVARLGLPLVRLLMPLLDPVCSVLQRWSETVADALTPARFQPHKFLHEEEMEALVQLGAEEGALQVTESEMIQEIIKLGDKTVKDCMTPRIEMFAIPDDITNEEAIARTRKRRARRVPVYGETPDDIIGVLDVKALLLDPSTPYTELMTPPSFVPETMQALALLRSFLKHPQGMAIIVDEFGGTEGIITLTDIIEEIISDAVPSGGHELYIENIGPGRLIVSGATRLDDLREHGVEIEEEGIDTIGGYIFNRLGQIPKPGTELQLEGAHLSVRRVSRKRITEVEIRLRHQDEGEAGA